jgi:DNA repair protein RadC
MSSRSPRRRLAEIGAEGLSDPELLALLLTSGTPGLSAHEYAEQLLADNGGLNALLPRSEQDSNSYSSTAPRAVQSKLAVATELAKRILEERLRAREVFGSPDAVKNYLQLHLGRKPREEFAVLFLDAQNRLMKLKVMFQGTLTQTSVYPREVVAEALCVGAAAVILAHNHPSGTVQPSRADEALTQTIKAALALVEVRLLDHIVVAPGLALSMAEKGLI